MLSRAVAPKRRGPCGRRRAGCWAPTGCFRVRRSAAFRGPAPSGGFRGTRKSATDFAPHPPEVMPTRWNWLVAVRRPPRGAFEPKGLFARL